jgi:hypothetical protein
MRKAYKIFVIKPDRRETVDLDIVLKQIFRKPCVRMRSAQKVCCQAMSWLRQFVTSLYCGGTGSFSGLSM